VIARRAWLIGAAAFACAVLLSAGPACGPDGEAGNVTGPSPQPGAPLSAGAAQPYAPGATYFGRNAYIEFRAGTLPIIVSAPHGGSLEPAEIPSRTSGTTVTDVATEDLARAVADALASKTGRQPSLVICRLKRTKVDVNREIGEGTQGNPFAEQAWREFHGFLDAARALATTAHGRALLVDVHGHGHPKPRVEIGYLLGAADLDRTDSDLDDPAWARQSSIRTLAAESGLRFSALLRGPESLGGRLDRAGYLAVPGPATPSPGSDPYFEGGYITRRHGSADGGPVSAVQLELPSPGVRDTPASRAHFAAVLADALAAFFAAHFRIQL
jgi:hypothetical protein